MTVYRTCHNCAVDAGDCPTRKALRVALAGHRVTSVKHRCAERVPLFAPGNRVTVTWTIDEVADHPDNDGYGPPRWVAHTWPATVVAEKGGKFIICVDDVDSDGEYPASEWLKTASRYAKVVAGKLKPLDEPKRLVCECGEVAGSGFVGCLEQMDRANWGRSTPPNPRCLHDSLSAQEKAA